MNDLESCPASETLHQFLLGRVGEEQAAQLERHLGHCQRCLRVMQTLHGEDTFVADMRSEAAAAAAPAGAAVEGLVERLAALPGDSPATSTEVPVPSAACTDLLTPPRGPGELGWLGGYRVLSVLGEGGMGVVFEAEDPQLRGHGQATAIDAFGRPHPGLGRGRQVHRRRLLEFL